MPKTPPYSELAAGYGARLVATRKAIAKTAKALAAEVGMSPGRWSHWETEKHQPDLVAMLALKLKYGVSLDWIFAGDPSGLRYELAQRIVSVASNRNESEQVQALVHLFGRSNIAGPGLPGMHEGQTRPPV